MIQLFQERLERLLYFRKIDQPARIRIGLAFTHNFDPKTMAVQPAALMPLRSIGQAVGRLKRKRPDQPNLSAGARSCVTRHLCYTRIGSRLTYQKV